MSFVSQLQVTDVILHLKNTLPLITNIFRIKKNQVWKLGFLLISQRFSDILILFINRRWRQSDWKDVILVLVGHRHPVQHIMKETIQKNCENYLFAAAIWLLLFPTHNNIPQWISMAFAGTAAKLPNVLDWIFVASRKAIYRHLGPRRPLYASFMSFMIWKIRVF